MLIKFNNLLILLCLLNGFLAVESNGTDINRNNHPNLRNTIKGNSGLIFSSLSFTHLSKYKLYMCTGSVKFDTITDCAAFAGNEMRCAFSSHPMTVDHFRLYTSHVYTIKCPSTPVNILSDDNDVKYFNCMTDTVYSMDMSKKYSEDKQIEDEVVPIVGIVFGTITVIVVTLSICCCCVVKKGSKAVICNCQPQPPILPAQNVKEPIVYSPPQAMPYIPPNSSSNINNNSNNNTMSTSTQPQCMPYIVAQQLPDGTVQYYSNQPAGPNQSLMYGNIQPNMNKNGVLEATYAIDPKLTPGGGCTVANLPGEVNNSEMNNNPTSDDEDYPSCKVVLPSSTLARNPV